MIKVLHVPKTGGTALKRCMIPDFRKHRKGEKYLDTPESDFVFCNHSEKLGINCKYVFFVRDPIDRFVSHFIFLKKFGAGYDTDKFMNPAKPKYINRYETADKIALDIFNIQSLKKLKNSYGKILGYKRIKKYRDNILFVGRTEHLESDFYRMQGALNFRVQYKFQTEYRNKRPHKFNYMAFLSDKGKENLREYLDNEYRIISLLCKLGFIENKYLQEINYDSIR